IGHTNQLNVYANHINKCNDLYNISHFLNSAPPIKRTHYKEMIHLQTPRVGGGRVFNEYFSKKNNIPKQRAKGNYNRCKLILEKSLVNCSIKKAIIFYLSR
ncbi:hypothetical protein AABB24_006308, partial [Solanum stoloniferum]